MGAAFLMATAAIGPGFITQTTVFTGQLFTSFGFAILISIIIDVVVQLNIWRIVTVHGKPAPQLVNESLPGLGNFLVVLIASGGFIFNIGNIGGCSLALKSLFGISFIEGAIISVLIAISIFLIKEFGKAMDLFTKVLGIGMIGLMLFVAIKSQPPIGKMVLHTILPESINGLIIITLVGGTVGGYISFAGAQRMLDAGYKGTAAIKEVNRGAVTGILLAGLMRVLLFAAVAGVVASGVILPQENPAAAVFGAAGDFGKMIFGIILWCAAITSVVAAAYTSVSFIASINTYTYRNKRAVIIGFMLASSFFFILIGSPTQLLIKAGTVNGLVLPLALTCMLWVVHKNRKAILLKHPAWLWYSGWAVTILLFLFGIFSIIKLT